MPVMKLRGHPVVVFFGYTHCPDVCPTTLAHLAKAIHSPTTSADKHVVFITVDPDRDSPGVLKRYVRLFDPQFIGLTGSLKGLAPVYAAYHMLRQAVPVNHGPNDYSIVSWDDDTLELTQDLKRFQ